MSFNIVEYLQILFIDSSNKGDMSLSWVGIYHDVASVCRYSAGGIHETIPTIEFVPSIPDRFNCLCHHPSAVVVYRSHSPKLVSDLFVSDILLDIKCFIVKAMELCGKALE